jgi:archaellum component FlaF (FlaF/FlaG flagellin family)
MMKELFWIASICLLLWFGSLFITIDDKNIESVSDAKEIASEVSNQVITGVEAVGAAITAKRTAALEAETTTLQFQNEGNIENKTTNSNVFNGMIVRDAPIIEEVMSTESIAQLLPAVVQSTEVESGFYNSEEVSRWEELGQRAGERAMSALESINLSLGR